MKVFAYAHDILNKVKHRTLIKTKKEKGNAHHQVIKKRKHIKKESNECRVKQQVN